MRGGGKNANSEKTEVLVSQILNEMNLWRSAIMRIKLMGNYDQVFFDARAPTAGGTCYIGEATTPCNVIGLFHSSNGVTLPSWDDAYFVPSGSSLGWIWYATRLKVGDNEVGTILQDSVVTLYDVNNDLCQAINLKLNGTSTISALSIGATSPGGYRTNYTNAGFGAGMGYGSFISFSAREGCDSYLGVNYAYLILEER